MGSSIAFVTRWLLAAMIVSSMGSSNLAKPKCEGLFKYGTFLQNVDTTDGWNIKGMLDTACPKLPKVKDGKSETKNDMVNDVENCCRNESRRDCRMFWGIKRNGSQWLWEDDGSVVPFDITCRNSSECVYSEGSDGEMKCTDCNDWVQNVIVICQTAPATETIGASSASATTRRAMLVEGSSTDKAKATTSTNPWLHWMALTSYGGLWRFHLLADRPDHLGQSPVQTHTGTRRRNQADDDVGQSEG